MPRKSVPVSRDYVAEMRAIVEAECVGAYKAPEKAAEIVSKLRTTDPELLIGFTESTIVGFIRDYINHWNRTKRATARRSAARNEVRNQFEAAIRTGDTATMRTPSPTAIGLLEQRFKVNDDGLQIPFAETGKPERLYIINMYDGLVKSNGFELAYHQAVQSKARNRITGDVFTEESLVALRQSL